MDEVCSGKTARIWFRLIPLDGKELEVERDASKMRFGMSLGVQRNDEEEEEEGALTRSVKAGTKVNRSSRISQSLRGVTRSQVLYNSDEVRKFRTLGLEPGQGVSLL